MKKWEPPADTSDSLNHLRDMLLFHANGKADMMKHLKEAILICKEFKFDKDIYGHGGSSATFDALEVIKKIENICTKAYKIGAHLPIKQ